MRYGAVRHHLEAMTRALARMNNSADFVNSGQATAAVSARMKRDVLLLALQWAWHLDWVAFV
jgi:hypothetical protein